MVEEKFSVRDLCEIIWAVEKELELNSFEAGGVKVWQYSRMKIYYELATKTGVLQSPHERSKSKNISVLRVFNYFFGAVLRNPFFSKKQSINEILIEHPRSKLVSGKNIDIYSQYYVEELERCGRRYMLLDRANLGVKHDKTFNSKRRYIDFFSIMVRLVGFFRKTRFSDAELSFISHVRQRIYEYTGCKFDFRGFFSREMLRFKVNYYLYYRLFKKYKPKRLTMVVGCAYGDAIKAAKDLGIETIELQHGTFSRYHLGYSFPGQTYDLELFPERFVVWGEFWKNMKVLPLEQDKVVVRQFSYFNKIRKAYSSVARCQTSIVVISQGAIGAKLAETVYNYRNVLVDHEIIYKLHPGEYARWRECQALVELTALPNVNVVLDGDLYGYLAKASYVIGVFSTAIYEGIGFGCKALLLDLPGVEYMDDVVQLGAATLVRDREDLIKGLSLDSENKALDPSAIFGFESDSIL